MSQRSFLNSILILIILLTMVGCGRRNTHFGLGIGIQIQPPKGVQKSLNLISWYSSSSTSSTTMDKEEFLGTAQLKQFIESNNDLLFEELARGGRRAYRVFGEIFEFPKTDLIGYDADPSQPGNSGSK